MGGWYLELMARLYAKIENEEKKGQGYHYNSVLYMLSYIRLFYIYYEKKNHYQNIPGDIILLKFCFLYNPYWKLLAIVLVFTMNRLKFTIYTIDGFTRRW